MKRFANRSVGLMSFVLPECICAFDDEGELYVRPIHHGIAEGTASQGTER